MKSFATALALTGTLLVGSSWAETPLLLERKIPLGEVRGRIDHLAIDLKRNRLFVAELENDTVAVETWPTEQPLGRSLCSRQDADHFS